MEIFEIHKYGGMPLPPPVPPAVPVFHASHERPSRRVREPVSFASFCRAWLAKRD